MTTTPDPETAAARYDAALCHAQARQRPLDYPAPAPTAHWPAENVAFAPAEVTPDENVNVLLAQLRAPRLDLEARLALVVQLHTVLQETIPEPQMVVE